MWSLEKRILGLQVRLDLLDGSIDVALALRLPDVEAEGTDDLRWFDRKFSREPDEHGNPARRSKRSARTPTTSWWRASEVFGRSGLRGSRFLSALTMRSLGRFRRSTSFLVSGSCAAALRWAGHERILPEGTHEPRLSAINQGGAPGDVGLCDLVRAAAEVCRQSRTTRGVSPNGLDHPPGGQCPTGRWPPPRRSSSGSKRPRPCTTRGCVRLDPEAVQSVPIISVFSAIGPEQPDERSRAAPLAARLPSVPCHLWGRPFCPPSARGGPRGDLSCAPSCGRF